MNVHLTEGQRQGLLAAGIIQPWGVRYGQAIGKDCVGYVLAPGMTWDDVYAVTGKPEDDRCYHVNGGERTVDGWTCDDCGQFFPLGTVVEGERSC